MGGEATAGMPERARCLKCGYLLAQVTVPVCPECGRGFDPKNPETYDPRSLHWMLARLDVPRWVAGLAVASAVTWLALFSSPSGVVNDAAEPFGAFLLAVYALVTCAGIVGIVARHVGKQLASRRLVSRSFVMFVLAGALCIVGTRTGAVFWARWWHAQPAFDAFVRQVGTLGADEVRWFGTFRVGGPVMRAGAGWGFRLSAGEWYSFDDPHILRGPIGARGDQRDDLGGGWFLVWDSC